VSTVAFVRLADRLIDQVSRWTPPRWTVSSASGTGTRADATYALAQRLADLEADATGHERFPVPRLDNDLALPDQVRVMVLDLVAADPGPEVLDAAMEAVRETRREL
jgi:hypothetical protein